MEVIRKNQLYQQQIKQKALTPEGIHYDLFGFIHESIRLLMIKKYGEDFWLDVLKHAGFESGKENIQNLYYADEDTFRLIDSVSALSRLPSSEVWEMYGGFLVEYTMELGWDELMRSMSKDLKGFLDTLDALHYFIDHIVFKANLRGPSFRCEDNGDGTLTLHYISARTGLFPIVKGVLREVTRRVFKSEIEMKVIGRTQRMVHMATSERLEEHVIFHIKETSIDENDEKGAAESKAEKDTDSVTSSNVSLNGAQLRLSSNDFAKAFPYHMIFDEECKLRHLGHALRNHIRYNVTEAPSLVRLFNLQRPEIPLDYQNIMDFINSVFIFECRTPSSEVNPSTTVIGDSKRFPLMLKGQMIPLSNGRHILYMCSPFVTCISELIAANLRINNIPLHDNTRDMILLNQQRMSEVEINRQFKENNDRLEQMGTEIAQEKEKATNLLLEVLPPSVATQLMEGKNVDACEYESATVMFSDVPNFQFIVQQTQPKLVVHMLNDLFTRFDRLVELHKVYKVETIGDSYMVVAGAPEPMKDHAESICYVGLGMLWESMYVTDPVTTRALEVRVGIHSGSIVTGVVGKKMPRYCLFGDTVNTASRMESHSQPRRIHCSDDANKAAQLTGRFTFIDRGIQYIKGKGEMNTFYLTASRKKSVWEIIGRERDEDINSIDGYEELNADISLSNDVNNVGIMNNKTDNNLLLKGPENTSIMRSCACNVL